MDDKIKVELIVKQVPNKDGEDTYSYVDLFTSTKYFKGFYIPKDKDDMPELSIVNVIHRYMGECSYKRSEELEKILINKFV